MPRVHDNGFQKTSGLEEEQIFDWSQMVAPFFRAHGASRMRTCTIQNSNQIKQKQKTFKQNYSKERVERRKHPQTLLTQEILKKNKQQVYRRELEAIRV